MINNRYNPEIHHRKSIRLSDYDYSAEGAYFITICLQNREKLFGEIGNGTMHVSHAGKMIEQYWQDLPQRFPCVLLDEFVVMPNHFHGIIIIENIDVGSKNRAGTKPASTNLYHETNVVVPLLPAGRQVWVP